MDALRVVAGVRGAVAIENMTILHAELSTAEAIAHREIGDRSRAFVELEALAEAPAETMLYCKVLAILELAQAHLDNGDLVRAQRSFAAATTLVDNEAFGADGRVWLARAGTRVALATGDIESGRRWSIQVDDTFWGPVSAARVHLAVGERTSASAILETAAARCPRHEVVLGLLRAQSADDREVALKLIVSAVEPAAANGLLQTVVSEGPQIVQMAERAAWRTPPPWMERLRRAAVGGVPRDPHTTHEVLTERERDVLRFLPSRLTLGEIASELFISVNTLKFHLKVIYRKLGVSSRAEAADVARRQ
jgi:LuxR family maltose regulon positive regulatory protein